MTELNNGIQNGAQEVSKLMLKAVFWDMDGTLIDSEPYWHEGELKIAADHGGYWDEDLAWQGSGTPVPDVARRMVELSGLTVRDEANPEGDISDTHAAKQ